MPGWYRSYTGQSIGRALHFLYVYGGLDIAEQSMFGDGAVTYRGKKLANKIDYIDLEVEGLNGWKFKSRDVPVFEFTAEFSHLAKVQAAKQRVAILESAAYEAGARLEELRRQTRTYSIAINILSMDGKATWDWKSHPKVVEAEKCLEELQVQIDIAAKEVLEAGEHEFDYAYVTV